MILAVTGCAINTFPFQNVRDNEFNDIFTIHTEIICLSFNYLNALFNNIEKIEHVEMSISDSYIDSEEANIILKQHKHSNFFSICVKLDH